MEGMVETSKYLGDPKTADWVYQGTPLVYNNESILLTMPARSVGTVLATTTYMWYGTVTARLKTSRGAGIVTAFILLSDVKDEIDYEFVGTELEIAQTNYYSQGIPIYANSANLTLSNTYHNWHTYQIRWTPDTITWLVDNQVGRVKKRSDTWNATANQWNYPQTPARVQISIWPGGASSNAPGTIQWAGGLVDWDSDDINKYGYDFATFGEISIQCFNASSAPGTNNAVSYTYNNLVALNNSVGNGYKPTVLRSFLGTGLDMDIEEQRSSISSSESQTHAPVDSIPGGSPSLPASGEHMQSGFSSTVVIASSSTSCAESSFSQYCGSSSGSSKSDGGRIVRGQRVLGASAIAVVIAFGAVHFVM
ncbi:cell wall glucanase [Grosmannia clavigera kw1407]|uniref:Cell wall glucanase n=1 Tax=Grosmannia clavigera (strain kw1407 / UAMH 11150) TaxID=655863 RepID=F0XAU5_GROCL|nr:cell wall glucanase [Grosmannia clavigera kw1407]EFX05192.1 cell wall glucanase [Grosmannia clavigera kw1407]